MNGMLFDIAEATLHDGPGLRVTVFFKGCPMRCRWCHSPEGQRSEPEVLKAPGVERLAGELWTPQRLADYLNALEPLLPGGGVTFSGGEPLAQAAFLLELLPRLSPTLHRILDTSGCGDGEALLALSRRVNLVFLGLKIVCDDDGPALDAAALLPILDNLRRLTQESTTPIVFRVPLLAGVTDTPENLAALAALTCLPHVQRLDFLPSNPNAGAKYAACGRIWDPGFDPRAASRLDLPSFAARCAIPVQLCQE